MKLNVQGSKTMRELNIKIRNTTPLRKIMSRAQIKQLEIQDIKNEITKCKKRNQQKLNIKEYHWATFICLLKYYKIRT